MAIVPHGKAEAYSVGGANHITVSGDEFEGLLSGNLYVDDVNDLVGVALIDAVAERDNTVVLDITGAHYLPVVTPAGGGGFRVGDAVYYDFNNDELVVDDDSGKFIGLVVEAHEGGDPGDEVSVAVKLIPNNSGSQGGS